jgi:hypothetical protein
VYEYRCDERLKSKVEGSTRLAYTGFHGGLEHLKIETRLIDERFASVKRLLWIDKARTKTDIWLSVLWKTKNQSWRFYTPHIHWVPRVKKIVILVSGLMVKPEVRDLVRRVRHQRTWVHILCAFVNEEGVDGEGADSEASSLLSYTLRYVRLVELGTLYQFGFREQSNRCTVGMDVYCCLLLIDKAKTKDKTYIWLSVWWKTKT